MKNLDEINILADAIESNLRLRYTTHLINHHRHHEGFNAVCKSTVNIAFLRIQHKRTKIKKIQQGTNNDGMRKEARPIQTKQWLIITIILPEVKG